MTGQGGRESASEEVELGQGIDDGFDPQPASSDHSGRGASGVSITRSWSWWNGVYCRTCGHTFRRGDRVLVIEAAHSVQHLAQGLQCGTDPEPGGDQSTAERDDFAAGLLKFWPASVAVTRLPSDDWRIPRRGAPPGARTPVCLYCGHTFRAGEYVVICPCTPGRPACGAAVHRDPAAGLPCWDQWRPGGEATVCPITLARL